MLCNSDVCDVYIQTSVYIGYNIIDYRLYFVCCITKGCYFVIFNNFGECRRQGPIRNWDVGAKSWVRLKFFFAVR